MNNREQNLKNLKKEYLQMDIPAEGIQRMQESIERARAEKRRREKRLSLYRMATAAAALLLLVMLPNTNASVAYAMSELPLVGGLFKLVTFRDYSYEDAHHGMEVELGQIVYEDGREPEAVGEINLDMQQLTDKLVEEFKASLADPEANKALNIETEVVTDREDYFVVRLNILESEASGYEYNRYYTIDKRTGKRLKLKELFPEGTDYVTLISENIKAQMRAQMAADEGVIYFVDDKDLPEYNFDKISEEQNFYIDEKGRLVIAFDEYEVAPGSMGAPEFVINTEIK